MQTAAMRRAAKRVWFLVPPGTGILNVAAPWEVLGHANDVLGRIAYEPIAFAPTAPSASTRQGLTLAGLRPLPRRVVAFPDVCIVAGGSPREPLPAEQAPVVSWLRRWADRIPTIVSTCTGAFLLGAAGLLDGRRATTHWLHLRELQRRFPAARVVDDGVYVEDRGVWTSAGVTACIDLALALVERDHGHRVAIQVAKRMVLFLRRAGHQAQFSSALQRQEKEPPRLREISAWIIEHIDEALPVERLAAGVGMSARSLSRWCRAFLGESPAALVRRLRVDEARRQLEETDFALKEIARRSGLGDASTLWRCFVQQLGVTPVAYRQRFTATVRPSASAMSAARS